MARRRQQSKKKRKQPTDAQLLRSAEIAAQRWQAALRRERRTDETTAELRSDDRRRF